MESPEGTVTVLVTGTRCACDEWVMCPAHEAENDAVVAAQHTYDRMMDDAGITRMTREYRTYRANVAAEGSLDADLERYGLFSALVSERPVTCPVDPMSRRWNRTRVSKSAPNAASLTDSPIAATERSKIEW